MIAAVQMNRTPNQQSGANQHRDHKGIFEGWPWKSINGYTSSLTLRKETLNANDKRGRVAITRADRGAKPNEAIRHRHRQE